MKRKETRNRDRPDAVKREITACTPSNRAELENPTHRSTDLSENSSANTSKKESNSSSYVENFVFQQMQQSSALGNNCVNDCSLGYKKLPEQQSQPNNQNRHCVDGPRYTNSNVSYQAEINNLSAFGSSVALQPVAQHVDGNCVAENVNRTDVSTSLNREDMPCSENTDSILSSKKPMPTNRPAATKREVKLWENVVTAPMLKIRRKKASEQMQEPDPQESEKVIPETVVPKKPEGCALTSMSADSEEVLQVINECWASPPKRKKDSGNELSPELHEQPEDIDFQNSPLLKMPAALTGGTGVFLNNKENALPQSTKQKENSEFANSPTLCFGDYMLPEPRALDDTCCSLMFSKTLISSTPNRKSGGPLSSDSSDTSPPDSQEFKIPRRYTPLRAEGFGIMQQPGLLSVIMESSKENKSQSSSGSSSGGRATHHTALSLVSPQTENTPSVLEMQPTYEAHVLKARSLSPLYEGNSSI